MRILVVSDSHGDYNSLKKAIASQPTAEVIVHCGDGAKEVEALTQEAKALETLGRDDPTEQI